MFAAVLLIALLAAVVLGLVIVSRGGPRASRRLRWAAFGLTLIVVAALTPYTVADSGASSLYLLGVPAVAAAVPLIADLTGVARIAAGSARSAGRASRRDAAAADATVATVTAAQDVARNCAVGEVTVRPVPIE